MALLHASIVSRGGSRTGPAIWRRLGDPVPTLPRARRPTNARVNPIAEWATSISLQRSPRIWLRRAPVDAASHR
jgi:hypothetical protein